MTNQEYNTLKGLFHELEKNCCRVAKAMRRVYFATYDQKYAQYNAETPCGITHEGVFCRDVDSDDAYYSFMKKEWIFMSDEELDNMVNKLINEWENAKKEREKNQKEKEREKDIAEYERLKTKLGL